MSFIKVIFTFQKSVTYQAIVATFVSTRQR